MSKVSDNDGLMQMGFIIQSIACKGDLADMEIIANVVAGIPPQYIKKYWEDGALLRKTVTEGLSTLKKLKDLRDDRVKGLE